jgi:16S rRNA (adenine1518-N6/adenine1519-N6)-dimethyltransferase
MTMNRCSPSAVRACLDALGVRPRRALGQNFLVDRNILDRILQAAEPARGDRILEIGPGLGVLTEALADRARQVIAVEKDPRLYAYLCAELGGRANCDLRLADILDSDWETLLGGVDKVVSNLPYAVGSRALAEVVRAAACPRLVVVTVQRETAERLAAAPGTPAFGLLSAWAQWRYAVVLVKRVSPSCFVPRPDVTSAIVRLERQAGAPPAGPLSDAFYAVTKRAFAQRRKQAAGVLANGDPAAAEAWRARLAEAGVDPHARAEAVSPAQWAALLGATVPEESSRTGRARKQPGCP